MDGDVEGSGGGDGTADTGENNGSDVVVLNEGRGFGNKHERLLETVEETFAGLDRTLDTELSVMTVTISKVVGHTRM